MTGQLYELDGKQPTIHPDAWVAPTATIVGDVTIEEGASIWYGAILRADVAPITIRARTNIQDATVIHSGWEAPLRVGAEVTIGHGCILHCTEIADGALIGNRAVVLDGATVGVRSVVAAGSVVTAGTTIPPGVLAVGQPAKVVKDTVGSSAEMWLEHNAAFYVQLAERHRSGARLLG